MNGSPHGPLPITGDLPDEERRRAALYVAGWLTGRYSHAETLDVLGALGLLDVADTRNGPETAVDASKPSIRAMTRADAGRPRRPSHSVSTDPARTTSTTEETR